MKHEMGAPQSARGCREVRCEQQLLNPSADTGKRGWQMQGRELVASPCEVLDGGDW